MDILWYEVFFRFPNLGIQCVKRNEVDKSLEDRKEIRVDPFRSKIFHRCYTTN